MSDRQAELRLRMEMLRLRASLERAELASALLEVRAGVRRVQGLAGMVGRFGSAVAGGGGWPGVLASAVGERPWLGVLLLGAVRVIRRHPRWLLGAAVAAAIAMLVARHRSSGHDAGVPAPSGTRPA
jgi:hypothetical protein